VHKYQGEGSEIGYLAGMYDFFVLKDCDDMLAPNACDRYMSVINEYTEKNIATIMGQLYGFHANGGESVIPGESIWVQARCYNRAFIKKHDIHFPTGLYSRQGEDFPFIRKIDYAVEHDDEYENIKIEPYEPEKPLQSTAYWFPNEKSLSRVDPHYGQHLSGWTMGSSNSILDFCDAFNKKNGFEDEEDEYMKHEYLNANVYAFYNLLDFIREVSSTDYTPLEEDWLALRDNVKKLRTRLKDKYWDEIVYSDVEDMLYQVKHYSDVRFCESWIGTFYDYMNKPVGILEMDYLEMMHYASTLVFDGAGHETHSPQVIAWLKRHK
jgi:hypothetical protein